MQRPLLLNDLLCVSHADLDRAKVKFNQYNGERDPMESIFAILTRLIMPGYSGEQSGGTSMLGELPYAFFNCRGMLGFSQPMLFCRQIRLLAALWA